MRLRWWRRKKDQVDRKVSRDEALRALRGIRRQQRAANKGWDHNDGYNAPDRSVGSLWS